MSCNPLMGHSIRQDQVNPEAAVKRPEEPRPDSPGEPSREACQPSPGRSVWKPVSSLLQVGSLLDSPSTNR